MYGLLEGSAILFLLVRHALGRPTAVSGPASWAALACACLAVSRFLANSVSDTKSRSVQQPAPQLGVSPIYRTFCVVKGSNSEPYSIIVTINGTDFALVVDTGSSNMHVAAEGCKTCKLSPKYAGAVHGKRLFNITYGTGALDLLDTRAPVSVGGVQLSNASFGAITEQSSEGADPFDFFPASGVCYNTYAGVWGLAYQAQDAGPAPAALERPHERAGQPRLRELLTKEQAHRGATTNGTTVPLFDQLVERGTPNAFAIELCLNYYSQKCSGHAYRSQNRSWLPDTECGAEAVGHLMLGGASSSRLSGNMTFTPITDEVHYDLQLLGASVCGGAGCRRVDFPDPVNGSTENDCSCSTPKCATGSVDYCSFTVVDSGSGRIYLNTARNAEAMLMAMWQQGVVSFSQEVAANASLVRAFFFNSTSISHQEAKLHPKASITLHFNGDLNGGQPVPVPVDLSSVFVDGSWVAGTGPGLVQYGFSGDLDLIAVFQTLKFPTLLGAPFMQGKTVLFDRSRKRIGFGVVSEGACATTPSVSDIDILGANSLPTPGYGCRRGTGSGGGCPQ